MVTGSAVDGTLTVEPGARTWLAWIDVFGLAVFVVGAYVVEQIALLNRLLTSDGWLALVAGKTIAASGLPHRDSWTILAHGRTWVDQQWLAQLLLYGAERVGGLRLLLALGLVLAVGTFVAAAGLAVERGAHARALTWVLVVAVVPYGRTADNLRAQSLCYPLFLALVWVLTRDGALQSRVIFGVFPILVLWANLHGSVVLAAFLVSACAAVQWGTIGVVRAVCLVVGPWACIWVSPYALDLPRYYRSALANPAFGKYVAEWQPTTLSPLDVFLFVLAFAIVFLLGTGRSGWNVSERCVLLIAGAFALVAVRNGVWLALASVVLLAPALARVQQTGQPTTFANRMNRVLVAAVGLGLVAAVASTALRNPSWYTAVGFPRAAGDAAAAAAGTRGKVYASEEDADWLLWDHPQLAGRIAFDARLELLTKGELKSIFEFENAQSVPKRLVENDVFVLPPNVAEFLRRHARSRLRVAYADHDIAVLARR